MKRPKIGCYGDGASDEDAACTYLDTVAGRDDAYWGWRDGDFGLWPLDDE